MSSSTSKVQQKRSSSSSKARADSKSTVHKSKPKAGTSSSNRKLPSETSSVNDNTIFRVNFEIRGKVQGVHFRKYTQTKATSFGIRGWCQNTNYSTVIGCMEGPRLKIEQMKQWLKSTGSPKSIITGADFKESQAGNYSFSPGFEIIK